MTVGLTLCAVYIWDSFASLEIFDINWPIVFTPRGCFSQYQLEFEKFFLGFKKNGTASWHVVAEIDRARLSMYMCTSSNNLPDKFVSHDMKP